MASGYDLPGMKIVQTSARTVRIETGSGSFSVPYRIYWNGHDRDPESIVLDGNKVQAFFLFATVRDEITGDADGILISRSWSVTSPGSLRLSFEADFDASEGWPACLFPAAASQIEPRAAPFSVLGERTSLPASVFLFMKDAGVCVYSSLPAESGDAASIGIRRVEGEDGPLARVETRIPPFVNPAEPFGPRPEHVSAREETEIVTETGLEKTLAFSVVFAPRESIAVAGMGSALHRLKPRKGRAGPPPLLSEGAWRDALSSCLETHLYRSGGMTAARETASGPYLSVSASASLAFCLRRAFPSSGEMEETALRLADFCLMAQHPTGLYYETFDSRSGAWLGVPGKRIRRALFGSAAAKAPLVPLECAARTADLLLELSEDLERASKPGRKYALSAERFVDFFFDEKGKLAMPGALHVPGDLEPAEEGIGAFELFFPLARMARLTRRDRYGKALDAMAALFLDGGWDASRPPSSRTGRDPDSRAALSCGRIAAAMQALGLIPRDPLRYLSALAPWIRINRPPRPEAVDSSGGIADSFRRVRLLFRCAETAYTLKSLAACGADRGTAEAVEDLSRFVLEFSGRAPCGTGFLLHTAWSMDGKPEDRGGDVLGPVDARVLAREIEFAVRLREMSSARRKGKAR